MHRKYCWQLELFKNSPSTHSASPPAVVVDAVVLGFELVVVGRVVVVVPHVVFSEEYFPPSSQGSVDAWGLGAGVTGAEGRPHPGVAAGVSRSTLLMLESSGWLPSQHRLLKSSRSSVETDTPP